MTSDFESISTADLARRTPRIAISYWEERGNPVKHRLFDALSEWADLLLLDPDREHYDLDLLDLDLYHAAAWTHPALSDLERAEHAGIATINTYDGARRTTDRLERCRTLKEAGFHVPPFQFGLAGSITLQPPLLVKPRDELDSSGHDFEIVYTDDLEYEGERFVQEYVVPRKSYKIHRVGDVTRAVRLLGHEHAPREALVPRKFVSLADQVAGLFGLSLFELDVVIHKALYVVDVNPVVSLEAVEDAVEIYERLIQSRIESSR